MLEKVAEVVESSSTLFVAQCYRLYDAPPLGALVRVGDPSTSLRTNGQAVYGVVCNVATAPLDSGRRVLPRGEAEESEDDLYRENPQLKHVLATRFEVAIIGYQATDGVRSRLSEPGLPGIQQGLPPLPPHVHAFVFPCSPEEIALFAKDFRFLRLLLTAPNLPTAAADEVVSACVRQMVAAHKPQNGKGPDNQKALLLQAGRALARELTGDVQRLNGLLRGLRL